MDRQMDSRRRLLDTLYRQARADGMSDADARQSAIRALDKIDLSPTGSGNDSQVESSPHHGEICWPTREDAEHLLIQAQEDLLERLAENDRQNPYWKLHAHES